MMIHLPVLIILLSVCRLCCSYNIIVDSEAQTTEFVLSQDERVTTCSIDLYDETVFHLNPDLCSLLISHSKITDGNRSCCSFTILSQATSQAKLSVKFPICVYNSLDVPAKQHRVKVEVTSADIETSYAVISHELTQSCPSLLIPPSLCSCNVLFQETDDKYDDIFHITQSVSGCSSVDFIVPSQLSDYRVHLNNHFNHRYHHKNHKVLRHRRSSSDVFFLKSQFTVKIKEELPVGTVVTVMEIYDENGVVSSNVEYSMTPMKNRVSARKFSLNPTTGVVTTTVKLDREDMDSHSFTVYGAVSSGSDGIKQDSCTLRIKVDDVNDNKPVFEEMNGYEAHIPEHSQVGMQVATVTASDSDIGDNSRISYSISRSEPSTRAFRINSDGDIFVSGEIDREENSQYILTITAQDHGQPPFSSQSKVKIIIDDINDNTPQFTRARYQERVLETFQVGQIIANVSAVDRDSGDNGRITYRITYGNRAHKFALDALTGEMTLIAPLDYEEDHRGFHLNIEAVDQGRPPRRNSSGVVDINVVDVNDNKPFFINPPYQKFVKENFPSGQEVLRVHAYDGDYGTQSVLTYSLVSPPKNLPFAVETLSAGGGSIILRSGYHLDHEKVTKYQFQIRAVDRGRPPQSDVANVTVYVQDVNDNPPKFDQPTYKVRIKEDTLENQMIIKVNAVDPDEDSSLVSYQINRGNADGHFRYQYRSYSTKPLFV